MFTARERSIKLSQAMDFLEQADALIQEALGASDDCEELHNRIQELTDDVQDQEIFMGAEA